jgi:hypothetical protein
MTSILITTKGLVPLFHKPGPSTWGMFGALMAANHVFSAILKEDGIVRTPLNQTPGTRQKIILNVTKETGTAEITYDESETRTDSRHLICLDGFNQFLGTTPRTLNPQISHLQAGLFFNCGQIFAMTLETEAALVTYGLNRPIWAQVVESIGVQIDLKGNDTATLDGFKEGQFTFSGNSEKKIEIEFSNDCPSSGTGSCSLGTPDFNQVYKNLLPGVLREDQVTIRSYRGISSLGRPAICGGHYISGVGYKPGTF